MYDDIKDEPTEEQLARKDHDDELKAETYLENTRLYEE
jgi:hypothetical protein